MKETYYRKSQRTHAPLLQPKTELMFIYPKQILQHWMKYDDYECWVGKTVEEAVVVVIIIIHVVVVGTSDARAVSSSLMVRPQISCLHIYRTRVHLIYMMQENGRRSYARQEGPTAPSAFPLSGRQWPTSVTGEKDLKNSRFDPLKCSFILLPEHFKKITKDSAIPQMDAASSSVTLVLIHQYTWHNVPDDCNLHQKKNHPSQLLWRMYTWYKWHRLLFY